MVTSFFLSIMAGLFLGYLAGLGIGGGSLLIMWLTLVLQMDQPTARAINLMFFIAAAGAVSLFRWKDGRIHLKIIRPAILSGCISAFLFSCLGKELDISILKKLFGIMLLATGLREVLYKPRKKEG